MQLITINHATGKPAKLVCIKIEYTIQVDVRTWIWSIQSMWSVVIHTLKPAVLNSRVPWF